MSILHREDVHLIDYLRVIYKRRYFMLIVLLVALGSTMWSTSRQTPIFASKARVLVSSDRTLVSFQGVEQHQRLRMDTEMHLMKSLEVAQHAVATKLRRDLEPGEPEFEALVNQVRAATNVKIVPNTLIVEMSAMADEPDKARDWCAAMAKSYVELNFERSKQSNAAGSAAIREQIDKNERDLELDERRLMDFKQANMVLSDSSKRTVQDTVTGTGTSQRVKNSLLAIESQQKYAALKRYSEKSGYNLPLSPDLAPSPLVHDLYEEIEKQRRELQALLLKYREQHPKVQAVKAALASAERSFDAEIQAALGVLKAQIEVYTGIDVATKAQIGREKQKFLEENRRDWQYRILQRNVDVKSQIAAALLTKLAELNVASSIVRNNVRLVEQPKSIPIPVRPNWRFNLLVGLAFGLAVAFAGVFFLEYLDKTLKTPDDIATYLDLPVLAVVPIARTDLLRAPYEPPRLREGEDENASGESAA